MSDCRTLSPKEIMVGQNKRSKGFVWPRMRWLGTGIKCCSSSKIFSHINICVVTKQIRDKTIRKVTGFSRRFLTSRSFLKINGIHNSKSNMADKTLYYSYFPAIAARFVKKTAPIRTFLN